MEEIKDYPPYLDYPKPYKPITNADKIRSMSDEELAKFVDGKIVCPPTSECSQVCGGDCVDCWLEWLQLPVETRSR